MEVNIRRFVGKDKAGVLKCISELKEWEGQFDSDYLTDETAARKLFEDIKVGEIFVAELDGQIVGFVSLVIGNKNDELIVGEAKVVYVSDIAVLPEYRNKGIGKKLLNKAYEYANKKKIKYIKLIAFSKNIEAIRLYTKEGFLNYETTMLKKII